VSRESSGLFLDTAVAAEEAICLLLLLWYLRAKVIDAFFWIADAMDELVDTDEEEEVSSNVSSFDSASSYLDFFFVRDTKEVPCIFLFCCLMILFLEETQVDSHSVADSIVTIVLASKLTLIQSHKAFVMICDVMMYIYDTCCCVIKKN